MRPIVTVVTTTPGLPVQLPSGTAFMQVSSDELLVTATIAHAQGPVVIVAADEAGAGRALEAGVDEALTIDEAQAHLSRAVERARLRHGLHCGDQGGSELAALELFGESLALVLKQPLEAALRDCRALESLLLDFAVEPDGEQCSTRRPSLRPASDTLAGDAARRLEHAIQRVNQVLALGGGPNDASRATLVASVREVLALARPALEQVASVVFDVPSEECVVRVSHADLVLLVGGLLRLARNRCAAVGGERLIELRIQIDEAFVLIEIADDGEPLRTASTAGWFLQFGAADQRDPEATALALAARRARQAGGRLALYTHRDEGTTAQIRLSRVSEPRLVELPRRAESG